MYIHNNRGDTQLIVSQVAVPLLPPFSNVQDSLLEMMRTQTLVGANSTVATQVYLYFFSNIISTCIQTFIVVLAYAALHTEEVDTL